MISTDTRFRGKVAWRSGGIDWEPGLRKWLRHDDDDNAGPAREVRGRKTRS